MEVPPGMSLDCTGHGLRDTESLTRTLGPRGARQLGSARASPPSGPRPGLRSPPHPQEPPLFKVPPSSAPADPRFMAAAPLFWTASVAPSAPLHLLGAPASIWKTWLSPARAPLPVWRSLLPSAQTPVPCTRAWLGGPCEQKGYVAPSVQMQCVLCGQVP